MATPSYIAKTDFQKVGTGGSLLIDFGNYEDFDNFAYEIEQKYMTKLFGVYLRNIVDLKSGQSWTDGTNYYEHHGTTAMIQQFFYFHYYTDIEMSVKTSSDAATAYIKTVEGVRHLSNRRMIAAYNKGVDYFNELVDYINYRISEGSTDYPGFATEKMTYINIFGI
jgi:hypothetical protein